MEPYGEILKTIGIVGSRRRDTNDDYNKLLKAFDMVYQEGDKIVSGGCPKGGDAMAERLARKIGCTITIHFPAWDKHGKVAGFIRNGLIAQDADVLIALVADDRTGGTEDTVEKFIGKLGTPVDKESAAHNKKRLVII